MTLLFCDSFDHYVTADIPRKWSAANSNVSILAAAGRWGSSAMHFAATSSSNQTTLALPVAASTVIIGFAINMANGPSTTIRLLNLLSNGSIQGALQLSGSGTLTILRGSSTALVTATESLSMGVWSYLELKYVLHDSAGSAELRINGNTIATVSGVDTKAGLETTLDTLILGPAYVSNFADIDDLYICDNQGSVNNSFLGDVRIECLRPTGAGATTQLTPSAGANYTTVDDTTANTSDYVSSTAVDQIDTYAMANLASTAGPIKGVQISALAQKSDAGAKSIALIDRTNSIDHVSSDVSLGTEWKFIPKILEKDSGNGNVDWTVASVNAMEVGVKSRP